MSTEALFALVKLIQALQRIDVLKANGLDFDADELSTFTAPPSEPAGK